MTDRHDTMTVSVIRENVEKCQMFRLIEIAID